MTEEQVNYFSKLNKVDVSAYTETKNDKFTYLSWAFAQEVLGEHHPKAIIEVREYGENNLPYLETPLGFFVQVYVTIEGVKRGRPFVVSDNTNRPLGQPYWDKKLQKYVDNRLPTAFDINTAIQRAFVKSVAEHGLGLYIYAGEDLPTGVKNDRRNFILNEFTTWRENPKTDAWFVTKETLLGEMGSWDDDALENYHADLTAKRKQAEAKKKAAAEQKTEETPKEEEGENGVPFPDLKKVKFVREATEQYPEINTTVDEFMTKYKKLEYADLTQKQFENLCNIVQRKLQTVKKEAVVNEPA